MSKRQPPAHSVTWMQRLAQEKREKTANELEHLALVCAKWIRASVLDAKRMANQHIVYPSNLEDIFDTLYKGTQDLGFTLDNFWYAQRKAIHVSYGDPKVMAQSNGYKPHALPYWNPTIHRLNIAPLGIVELVDPKTREARTVDFVPSGGYIMIPTSYTVGGKYSSLRGVCPQLAALPRQVDEELDLAPLTYAEWCTYQDTRLTKCCKKMPAWHDKGDCLVCTKCGNRV